MKKLLALALFALLSQYTHAVNWIQVDSDGKVSIYLDLDSVQTHRLGNGGTYTSAWVGLEMLNEPRLVQGFELWRETSHIFVDCANQKAAQNYFETYDRQGAMLNSGNFNLPTQSSASWQAMEAGSVGERWHQFLCSSAR